MLGCPSTTTNFHGFCRLSRNLTSFLRWTERRYLFLGQYKFECSIALTIPTTTGIAVRTLKANYEVKDDLTSLVFSPSKFYYQSIMNLSEL
jgi:hypothetical protein